MKVKIHTNIQYLTGNSTFTSYDLYLPAEIKSSNLLIWIHGGAWVSGDKDECVEIAKNLVEKHQIATVIINYRLSARPTENNSKNHINKSTIQHPIHTQDCLTGILHALSNLSEFDFTAKDVYIGGHSAGGHLTGLIVLDYHQLMSDSMILTYPHYQTILSKIRGAFVTAGIFDLVTFSKFHSSYKPNYVIPAFGTDPNIWRSASPQHIKLCTLRKRELLSHPIKYHLIHSTKDLLVEAPQAENYQEKLLSLGITTECDLLDLGEHDDAPNTSFVLQRLAEFINGSY